MNLNELRDFKLTLDEWNLIPGIRFHSSLVKR